MAVIQRPVKTYGTRSYVGETAAAPGNVDPILANEVDGDLDTIYGAWNAGADSVNIKAGSITYDKLALDARLWEDTGTALRPGPSFTTRPLSVTAQNDQISWGAGTIRGTLSESPTGEVYLYTNESFAPQDATKSSWFLTMTAAGDAFYINRRAPNAAAAAHAVYMSIYGSSGMVTFPGLIQAKQWGAGITRGTGMAVGNGATIGINPFQTVWFDSTGQGRTSLSAGYLLAPNGFSSQVVVAANVSFTPNTGFGVSVELQVSGDSGSSWAPIARVNSSTATTLSLATLRPCASDYVFRIVLTNATGGTITLGVCEFFYSITGTW